MILRRQPNLPSNFRPISTVDLNQPPPTTVPPWPVRLYPKRLAQMIKRQQNLDLSLQIFTYAAQLHPGVSHNYETYLAMIEKLSRARQFPEMETLLAQLQTLNLKCGENLFITVIRNYGIASRPKLALQTFLRIKDFGVERYFNSLQSECFSGCFFSDINMVISAPTEMGKTVLFELCILRLLSRFLSKEGKFIRMKGTLKIASLENSSQFSYFGVYILTVISLVFLFLDLRGRLC